MDFFIPQVLSALGFGTEYALIAIGLAIVLSNMGMVKFAHAEMIAVGGYTKMALGAIAVGNSFVATFTRLSPR
ncbi:MAG: hypothetical protein OXI87_11160 [Albidovulum sp.]|nr:hypothetical protein [Albidovulum sp.]MDE0532291.1 hypothetical protein [Albidovulum sp.]